MATVFGLTKPARGSARRSKGLPILVSVMLAAAAMGVNGPASASGGTPIEIGVLLPFSGPEAVLGDEPLAGMKVALKEINAAGGVLGRPLKLVTDDDQVEASLDVQDLRSFSSSGIHLVIGLGIESEMNGVAPLLKPLNELLLCAWCSDNYDTYPTPISPLLFRTFSTSSSLLGALGVTVCKDFPSVKYFDYLTIAGTPVDAQDEFAHAVKSCGITFKTAITMPDNVTNTLPYLESLEKSLPANSSTNTVLLTGVFGSALTNMFKVAQPIGFLSKFAGTFSYAAFDVEATSLGSQTPSIYSVDNYYYKAFNTALNSEFVKDFKAANGGQVPYPYNFAGYRELRVLAAAIEKAKSISPDAVANAMAGLSIKDPQGRLTINAKSHQGDPEMVVRHFDGASVTVKAIVSFSTAFDAGGGTIYK